MSPIILGSIHGGTQHHNESLEGEEESWRKKEIHIDELVKDVLRRIADFELPISPRLDVDFIEKFVRCKKYNAEKAAGAIKKYYEHIHRYQKRTVGLRPSDLIPAFESGVLNILKNRCRGSFVNYVHVQKWEPSKCSQKDLMSTSILMREELLLNKTVQSHAGIGILNFAGLGFKHIKYNSLSDYKYYIHMALDGLPMRAEAFHVVNPPSFYWPIHKILMKLLSVKVRKRFHVHDSLESLHKFLDKSILPASLGGDLDEEEAFDSELIVKIIKENKCYEEYWNPDLGTN